jgi:hypothetical protein
MKQKKIDEKKAKAEVGACASTSAFAGKGAGFRLF